MNTPLFEKDIEIISHSLASVDTELFEALTSKLCRVLQAGHKAVLTGVGKNYPICVKVADTMKSMGMQAYALHAYEALHGSMGMITSGDMLIILSKSGETQELVQLVRALETENVETFLICFSRNCSLAHMVNEKIIMRLEHEGDLWNILPNNSTAAVLILLQKLAVEAARYFDLERRDDWLKNHPGGEIGKQFYQHKTDNE